MIQNAKRMYLRLLLPGLLVLSAANASPQLMVRAVGDYCLTDYSTWAPDAILISALTVNPRTGETATLVHPTIPPNAMFSPDGNYAAFWETLPNTQDEGGLYIASVATKKA